MSGFLRKQNAVAPADMFTVSVAIERMQQIHDRFNLLSNKINRVNEAPEIVHETFHDAIAPGNEQFQLVDFVVKSFSVLAVAQW